jgi:NADH:ubiquinone oxidoreductase subunit F (NADH-binding)/NADH:ubiquinone oxidoreductase subunit E
VDGDLADVLAAFPRERSALLPALHAVQHALGWLPEAALAATAAHVRVPASEVYGVATHYPEFRLAARGRHHVRVCTGVSCALLGGLRLLETIAHERGVTPGAMGAERTLTLERADCFFACSMAPLVEVDGECHGRVGLADVRDVGRWFHDDARAAHGSTREVAALTSGGVAAESARAFHAELVRRAGEAPGARAPLTLLVQAGTCGRAVGAGDVLGALRAEVGVRGMVASVVEGACNGMCYAAPVVEIRTSGVPRSLVERVTPARVARLLDALTAPGGDLAHAGFSGMARDDGPWRGLPPIAHHPFWQGQERVLLRRTGTIDPEDIGDALRAGAYAALAGALDGPPEDVIARVKASGLEGRGGAYFPAALKWEACRRASGQPKYVVLNGEEGEPGIFKDRHLMEGDPHRILEGVLLAAYAAGATRAILYVHGEADLAARRMARAVADAEAAGIVGARMLGRDVGCHVELRRGAGGFVLGEETALLESIEGRRAQPRTRPPFPVESGLWGRPTVINNVETLAAVPDIVQRGGPWFAGLGTDKARGTKIFGLSGPLLRPGVVEVRNGVTLRDLLERIGGGATGAGQLVAAVVGGPSGSIVPAALFDVPMEPRGRVSPGTGGVVGVPVGASIAEIVRILLEFNAHESCGKCTPCREGLPRLLATLDAIGGDVTVRDRARALAETIQAASLCGLGQAAPVALLRALETFADAFDGRS